MNSLSADELLRLLLERPTAAGHGPGIAEHGHAPQRSETALKVDRWGRRRAEELTSAEWNGGDTPHDSVTLADCHAACFEPSPALADNPSDAAKAKWFEHLLESPDFRGLHAQTTMDTALSELGAKQLADQWRGYADSLSPEERDHIEQGREESIESEIKRIRSTAKAISQAAADVDEAQAAASGLGLGDGSSGPVDSQEMIRLFQRVRNDRTLRRICELAGRYRRVAQSRQRRKSLHGVDDTVGVELGGDVGRLIPAEAACLVIPELELDTLRRIAERQALCREYRGVEPVAKGPIVVCVDESGSMSGEPHDNAKAFALAMGWVAKHQKRWIAFVGFAGGTEGTRIAFPPGQWDQNALIDWLTHFYGGGTTLDVPLDELPRVYWPELGCPQGKTDVVIITDAIVRCPTEIRDSFLRWKQQQNAKCYGIVIGNSDPGDLAGVCERTWTVPELDVEQDAVGELLGI